MLYSPKDQEVSPDIWATLNAVLSQLADELQMPVVPLTIDGSFDVFSRCSKWPTWHPLRLTIHDPIPPLSKGAENIKTTMEKAYNAIESALPEKYKGQVENPDQ